MHASDIFTSRDIETVNKSIKCVQISVTAHGHRVAVTIRFGTRSPVVRVWWIEEETRPRKSRIALLFNRWLLTDHGPRASCRFVRNNASRLQTNFSIFIHVLFSAQVSRNSANSAVRLCFFRRWTGANSTSVAFYSGDPPRCLNVFVSYGRRLLSSEEFRQRRSCARARARIGKGWRRRDVVLPELDNLVL